MKINVLRPHYLILAGIISAYGIGVRTFPSDKGGPPTFTDSELQKAKDRSARAHTAEDELTTECSECRTATLTGGPHLAGISRLRTAPDGALYVLDARSRTIARFGAGGEFAGILGNGKTGSRPGEFIFPSDIDVHPAYGVSVSDFKITRISRFSERGDFKSALSFAGERFLARNVFRPLHSSDVYICGNRYGPSTTTIHRYSESGEFLGSLLPLPQWALDINADAFDDCLTASSESRTLVAFPFEYRVYELSEGSATPWDLELSPGFRKPVEPLRFPGADQQKNMQTFQNWKLTWTPLEAIALTAHDRLLVQYRAYDPLRYTIDVWDINSKKRVRTLHTNYRLLTSDLSGKPWFLAEHSNEEAPYEVLTGSFSW